MDCLEDYFLFYPQRGQKSFCGDNQTSLMETTFVSHRFFLLIWKLIGDISSRNKTFTITQYALPNDNASLNIFEKAPKRFKNKHFRLKFLLLSPSVRHKLDVLSTIKPITFYPRLFWKWALLYLCCQRPVLLTIQLKLKYNFAPEYTTIFATWGRAEDNWSYMNEGFYEQLPSYSTQWADSWFYGLYIYNSFSNLIDFNWILKMDSTVLCKIKQRGN